MSFGIAEPGWTGSSALARCTMQQNRDDFSACACMHTLSMLLHRLDTASLHVSAHLHVHMFVAGRFYSVCQTDSSNHRSVQCMYPDSLYAWQGF